MALGVDVLAPEGYGEVIGGGERATSLEFLKEQVHHLHEAGTESDFQRLLIETESRLLGEIANWYSRRAFTGVA